MTSSAPAVAGSALDRLCDPRSIAVIGASNDPAKRGYQAVRALRLAGYRHPVYLVNPRGGVLLGLPVCTDIGELPHGVDVALVALPGRAVPSVLRELAARGVAGAVVLANGFRESGAEGARLEDELRAVVTETGIRVIGPNTSGILNVASGANLVGVPDVPAGPVSVLTQSGNMLLSLLADNRAQHGPGFHTYLGLGNQVDVRYDECLTQLAGLPGTRAIAVHSEGLSDGRAFLVASARATRVCPVVLLRGGRSVIGQRSALSHTGSVAGSDAVAGKVLAQAGVELVDRSDELAVVAGVLATSPVVPAGRRVAVLCDGGGHATLAADALATAGVELAVLGRHTRARLAELLGPAAATANPIDVAGATDTDPTLFADATALLTADQAVGLVLIVGLYGGYHLRFDPRLAEAEGTTSGRIAELVRSSGLPVVVQSCYAGDRPANHTVLRTGGVPVLASIDHAVRGVAALYRRGNYLATAHRRSALLPPVSHGAAPNPPEVGGAPGRLPEVGGAGRRSVTVGGVLDEPAARRLAESAGLDIGRWRLARTAQQATEAVASFAGPCALKIVSPDVVHKSDVSGVRLGVTAVTAAEAYRAVRDSVRARVPAARISGVVVAPMAEPGVELLVGATVDPIFGPVVVFGSGGVLVEALGDVTFRAAPLTHLEASEMIEETAASRMLDGYRHLPPVDRDALARFLVAVGDFVAGTPWLTELDLNPVIANQHGIHPVDVRIVARPPTAPVNHAVAGVRQGRAGVSSGGGG